MKTNSLLLGSYGSQIGLLSWNPETSNAKSPSQAVLSLPANSNPSWLLWEPENKLLFAVEEDEECGKLHSYHLDSENKNLKSISSVETKGRSPCHILVVPDRKELWISNYTGGPVSSFQYTERGQLSSGTSVEHTFHGDPERQEMSHPHSCLLAPDGEGVYTADLGYDQIVYHPFADPSASITTTAPVGYGPRHMCLSREGRYLYVICELQPHLLSFKIQDKGVLEPVQECRITRQSKLSQCSEICRHPRLPYLYAANRNAGYIAQIHTKASGQIELAGEYALESSNPRHIAISSDGKYLFAALQDSNQIQVFSIHTLPGKQEGRLQRLSHNGLVAFEKPAYIGFIV